MAYSCSVFEAELSEHIPVVRTSIAGTRLVGRVTVGAASPCLRWGNAHVAPCEPLCTGQSILLVALHWCCSNKICTGPCYCEWMDEHEGIAAGNKNGLLLPNTATDQGTLMSQRLHHAVSAHNCSTCCSECCLLCRPSILALLGGC